MSRIANAPVELPSGVDVKLDGQQLSVKGGKGTLELVVHDLVQVEVDDGALKFSARNKTKQSRALSGTFRSLANNIVVGVHEGFEKKLTLNGVGYRAKASGKTINLTLGFSHPVDYTLPEGITAETPSQTEIVIKGKSNRNLKQR